MPTLLIPEKRTVPYLREAAARFQADLLLSYTTRIQTFEQTRLIGADGVKAACLLEPVLLDVRTGIVVYSSRNSETIATRKTPGDFNFSETVGKAQSDAQSSTREACRKRSYVFKGGEITCRTGTKVVYLDLGSYCVDRYSRACGADYLVANANGSCERTAPPI
jgi:hypothetical protein